VDAKKISFRDPISLDVGEQPHFISISDVDGNQYPDLIVANTSSDSVTIWLNEQGKFLKSTTTLVPDQPNAAVMGNFNEGAADLVTSSHGTRTIAVLFGDGTGNFPTKVSPDPATPNVGNGPRTVVIGKLNADDFDDIAVSSEDVDRPGIVSVFLGLGNGQFMIRSDYFIGPGGGRRLMSADVEPDGDLDLITVNAEPASISVLLNDGNGVFATLSTMIIGNHTISGTIGNFNRDTTPDLAIVDVAADKLVILLGKGDGTFAFAAPSTVDTGADPTSVASDDLNGDGKKDLVVTNFFDNSISVFKGKRKARFKTLEPLQGFADLVGPLSAAIGDLNNDSKPDLVVGCMGVNKVLVFFNNSR
jgi:hypothetical protein